MHPPSLPTFSPFLRGACEAMVVNGLGLFAALIAQAVVAQALGPAGFGDYAGIVAVAAIMSVFAVGGMDTALLRVLPQHPGRTMELVRRAERFLLLAILAGTPFALLWFGSIGEALVTTLLALFLAASTVRQFALRGNFIVFWGRFPDIVMRPVLFAVAVLVLQRWEPINPVTAVALLAFSSAIVFVFGALLLRNRVKPFSSFADAPFPQISRRDRSFWLGLSLLTMLMVELDKLVGSLLLSPDDFGHYALASRLYGFGVMATESLAVVAAPAAARAIAKGEPLALRRLEREVGLVLAGLVVGIFALIHVYGHEIVAFLAPGFTDTEECLKILAWAALVAPFVLPRVVIASVVNPSRAWQLQGVALVGLGVTSVGCLALWNYLGWPSAGSGLAWGIVLGAVFRLFLWRVWGKLA